MRNLYFLLLVFCACSNSTTVPEKVLPPAKMEAVLYDVIRADELIDFRRLTDSNYQEFSRRTDLYDTIFQIHKVSKETFRVSMKYYQGRPDLLKQLFEDLGKKAGDTAAFRRKAELQ